MPASIRSVSPDAAGDIGAALALEDLVVGSGGGGADCIGALACGRRSSFSYRRLPEPRLRLTVRKLDGSFFGTLQINPAPFFIPPQIRRIGDF
jgi:hypothetical protein